MVTFFVIKYGMMISTKGGISMYYGSGFDIMFTIVSIIVLLGFCFVIGSMIFQGISYMNDKSKPIQTERVKVVAKRTNVTRHHHNNHHSTSTTYYVTFEFLSGQRLELKVSGKQYGYIVEGDEGILQFQGQIFNSFERVPQV